jgi:hypothetical protein
LQVNATETRHSPRGATRGDETTFGGETKDDTEPREHGLKRSTKLPIDDTLLLWLLTDDRLDTSGAVWRRSVRGCGPSWRDDDDDNAFFEEPLPIWRDVDDDDAFFELQGSDTPESFDRRLSVEPWR